MKHKPDIYKFNFNNNELNPEKENDFYLYSHGMVYNDNRTICGMATDGWVDDYSKESKVTCPQCIRMIYHVSRFKKHITGGEG